MEDENELELSLGLFCGGSAAKSKSRNGSSSDIRTEESDRGGKIADDFKNFLHRGNQNQDLGIGSSRGNSVQSKNFLGDLSKTRVDNDSSINLKGKRMWINNNNNVVEIDEENRVEIGYKRKLLFEDMNSAKKHEREPNHSDILEKTRLSHVSINEDYTVAENEDVGESEVEYSTSRLISQHDDMTKRCKGGVGLSDSKETTGFTDSNVMDFNVQKRYKGSSNNEFKLRNLSYNHAFSVQNVKMQHRTVAALNPAGQSLPEMMQVLHSAMQPGTQPVNLGKMPMLFGHHPSAQLPTSDKDGSPALVSHPQRFSHWFTGKEREGKRSALEEGSSQAEENVKGVAQTSNQKTHRKSTLEAIFVKFSAIKPGLSADIKFGGCGSSPNLPWVSTTGSIGKTISGVTYRFNPNQIKIVCACHGSHMAPNEFVEHANEEVVDLDNGNGSDVFPNNRAASAQS